MTLADLREALHDVLSEVDGGGRPALYRILRAMAQRAEAGDVKAAHLLFDRAFGAPRADQLPPTQRHTIYIGTAPSNENHPERSADGTAADVK